MDNNVAAEVLEAAADLYLSEKVDWCQGNWASRTGKQERLDNGQFAPRQLSMCAEGALLTAAGFNTEQVFNFQIDGGAHIEPELELDSAAWARFKAATDALSPRLGRRIYAWNDRQGRVKQDVIDAFQETAKDLRNEGGNA